MSYEDWGLRRFPKFLKGTWGTAFVTVVAGVVQRAQDAVVDAIAARFVATAPDDALPYLAADTNLPHLADSESLGALRDRLADPWTWHADVGKAAGVDAILETVGFDPAETFVIDRSLGESWCHESGWWSSWWVVTRNPTGWGVQASTWNASGTSTWNEMAGGCWDVTANPAVFTQLHELLWKYKASHSVPVAVLMLFGDGFLWDQGIWAGTTWDDLAADSWDDAGDATTSIAMRTAALYDNDIRIVNGDTYAAVSWDQAATEGQRWSPKIRPVAG